MKIAYSAWGFIGDGLLDSPDGGRLTRALFIEHLIKRGHEVIWVQKNRDIDHNNEPLFGFNTQGTYEHLQQQTLCLIKYDDKFPNVDILFLEWRWPIEGRNCNVDKSDKNYTPDLDRQQELLCHYLNTPTKIIIWDKDEKMTSDDELLLLNKRSQFSCKTLKYDSNVINFNCDLISDIKILSPALYPIKNVITRQTLLFPCDLEKIKGTKVNERLDYLIGYIGSQYERDDQVYKYINPFAAEYPEKVIFVGNWMKYSKIAKRNIVNFPFICFADRILPKDMNLIYNRCLTSVLLCKKNYAEHGHITQRIHETAANGVIAIGLAEQKGIEQFICPENIITDAYDLVERIEYLKNASVKKRQLILDVQIEELEPFDIKNVVNKFEKIINE